MKQLLIISILFFSVCNAISQNKTIQGDTAYWYRWEKPLIKKLNLKDLSTSKDEFNFRFWGYGQIIEIWKNKNKINGTITNYIYKISPKNDTLFEKEIINFNLAYKVYNLLTNSRILELETDKKIEGWTSGLDGITYIIENSDNQNYYFKNYWTPSTQDSIPEALTLMNFINNLSDTLKLEDKREKYIEKTALNGCYNSGSSISICNGSNKIKWIWRKIFTFK